jgi:chromate reductase
MRILGISGSLRRESDNTKLLRAAGKLLPPDVELVVFEDLEAVPPYNEDRDDDEAPLGVARLREAIADADAVLFATPEYNGSVPGQLKNAVDWASRPHRSAVLWGKPVAVIGASSGMFGAVWAQADLRKSLRVAGARVAEAEVAVGRASSRFDEDGRLVDEELREELRAALDTVVAEVAPQQLIAA